MKTINQTIETGQKSQNKPSNSSIKKIAMAVLLWANLIACSPDTTSEAKLKYQTEQLASRSNSNQSKLLNYLNIWINEIKYN